MILISFYYMSKGNLKEGEKSFDEPEKAKKFCYGLSRRKGVHVSGWKCDSIEENEYMTRNVNLSRINGF